MSNSKLGVGGWIVVIALAFALAFIVSLVFMFAWNAGPAAVFGWPEIAAWWRAFCILLCAAALTPYRTRK